MRRYGDIFRKCLMGAAVVMAAALLCACKGPQFKPEEEAALLELGTGKMQEWLDERLPGEKVTRVKAFLDIFPSGPQRLTDYVEGTYTEAGEEYGFLLNTLSGEVFTDKGMDALRDSAWEYLLEMLELDPGTTPRRGRDDGALADYSVQLYFPSKTEGSSRNPGHGYYILPYLPAEVAYGDDTDAGLTRRIEEFLRDPERKYPVSFTADLKLPDTENIGRFTSGGLMEMLGTEGIYFDWIRIHNASEDLWHYGWMGHYCRYGWVDQGDFKLWTELDWIEDKRSVKAPAGYDRVETHVDPADFRPVTVSEKGYKIEYPKDQAHYVSFSIVASPGSEILQYDYLHTSDEGKTVRDCHWIQRPDGDWQLMNYDWTTLDFGYNTELWRRGEWTPEEPPEERR